MKAHPTIPAPPGNLQPATRHRRTLWRTPHFQLSIFNFQLLLVLIAVACTDEKPFDTTDPTLPVRLNPGEQAVTLTLGGMGKAATAKSEAGILSRADNKIIETEAVVNTLDIYCFVNLAQDGNDATAKADYTLERMYKYAPGGNGNDFTLVPDADGYRAAIGIPKDDRLRRFLAVANDNNTARTYTAIPVGSDRTSATPYADIAAWTGANTGIDTYLPATGTVPKRLAMNDGSYTEVDEPFSAEYLAEGLPITLYRLVARLDISNPATTGFTITQINGSYKSNIMFFPPYTLEKRGMQIGTSSDISNAEYIAGALYLYPYSGEEKNKITITGTLNGTLQTITVEATLKPNTRYLLRVRNDGNNVSATIEVAPWNEGSDIDTPLPGEYNTAYTLAPAVSGGLVNRAIVNRGKYAADIEQSARVIRVYSGTDASSFLTITGADGNSAPVGIVIPPEFADKIKIGTSTSTPSGAWQTTLGEVQSDDSGGGAPPILQSVSLTPGNTPASGSGISGRAGTGSVSTQKLRPESSTLTFITRSADGSYKYDEWTLVLDILSNNDTPVSDFPTVKVLDNGTTTDITEPDMTLSTAVYLPAFASANDANAVIPTGKYIHVSSTEGNRKTLSAYSTEDWLYVSSSDIELMDAIPPLYVYAVGDNLTGKERQAQLVTRRALVVNDDTGSPTDTIIKERRYTVIQQPVTAEDEARMASSAAIRLESGHKTDELYIKDNTIHVPPLNSNMSSGGGIRPSATRISTLSDNLSPFSILTPGGKPVIINLPDVDWITLETSFYPSRHIPSDGMISQNEKTPPGFFRQFLLQLNTTGADRQAYFDIITLVDGKQVTTTYRVIQYPEPERDTDVGEEM